jgi:DNA polymerase-3 subunit beta
VLKFKIARKKIINPLQMVAGVVERRQAIAVLSNILVRVTNEKIVLIATDIEIEMRAEIALNSQDSVIEGEITIPARKLLDICKSSPEDSIIELEQTKTQISLNIDGNSKYILSTLPANTFPIITEFKKEASIRLKQQELRRAINKTSFAMAHQDVRKYLNGILIDVYEQKIRLIATDAHRLSLCDIQINDSLPKTQILVPRKSILELARLLNSEDEYVELQLGEKHIRALSNSFTFTSKLIDGSFPNYASVIPKDSLGSARNSIIANREALKAGLQRASILCSEKHSKGIKLLLSSNQIKLIASNTEQEKAEETIPINYNGSEISIGFNVSYLLDVLAVLSSDNIEIKTTDTNSSVTIEGNEEADLLHVVMPMMF